MKRLLLTTVLAAGLAASIYGQGIVLHNGANTSLSTAATSNGLVWIYNAGVYTLFDGYNYNLGIEVYAGAYTSSLTYLGTVYPGDPIGTVYTGLTAGGQFAQDPSVTYNTGVGQAGSAWVQLNAWWYEDPAGTFSDYASAVSGGAHTGTVLFQNPTSKVESPPIPEQSLVGMPSVILSGTLAPWPLIIQQPTSLVVTQGQTATFTVTAYGTAPLSYQWRKEGSPILGATNNFLTLTNVSLSNAGNYDVVVTNLYGSATSFNVALTVVPLSGLIAYYPFNGNANDASGNGNHATPAGNYQYLTNGLSGGAIRIIGDFSQFYAGGGNVLLPAFGSYMNSGYSLSLWVRDEVIGVEPVGAEDYINFQGPNGIPHCQIVLLN